MRAVIQRVTRASVAIAGEVAGRIERGVVVLLGVTAADDAAKARRLADKIVGLRIFRDGAGKMNRTLAEARGAMLVISQFTLFADCRKGRRPSFLAAAPPDLAIPLYEEFIQAVRELGIETQRGRFGADMQVELVNDGPVTLILDTDEL